MKKILITGSNGFVGSFLVEEALKRKYEVYAGVRKSSNLQYIKHLPINLTEMDFSSKETLLKTLADFQKKEIHFDYIIHNAGLTQSQEVKDYYLVNYEATKNFIEALIETGMTPSRFIYTSSLAAYGPGDNNSDQQILLSDHPKPITSYGKSKLKAEKFIQSLSTFPYLILRPTIVYGPREENLLTLFKIINNHIEAFIGFKTQYLTFIYVKDLARLFLNLCENKLIRKTYFITDGQVYTSNQLSQLIKNELEVKTIKIKIPFYLIKVFASILEQISSKTGKFSILHRDKVNELSSLNWRCEVEPLNREMGFIPEFDLSQGIRETVAWYKLNGWL